MSVTYVKQKGKKRASHLISSSHLISLSVVRFLIINKNFLSKTNWNHGERSDLGALEQEVQDFDTECQPTSLEPAACMEQLSWHTHSEAHTSHDVPGKSWFQRLCPTELT